MADSSIVPAPPISVKFNLNGEISKTDSGDLSWKYTNIKLNNDDLAINPADAKQLDDPTDAKLKLNEMMKNPTTSVQMGPARSNNIVTPEIMPTNINVETSTGTENNIVTPDTKQPVQTENLSDMANENDETSSTREHNVARGEVVGPETAALGTLAKVSDEIPPPPISPVSSGRNVVEDEVTDTETSRPSNIVKGIFDNGIDYGTPDDVLTGIDRILKRNLNDTVKQPIEDIKQKIINIKTTPYEDEQTRINDLLEQYKLLYAQYNRQGYVTDGKLKVGGKTKKHKNRKTKHMIKRNRNNTHKRLYGGVRRRSRRNR